MLCLWAQQVQSGQEMMKEQTLEIFGGPYRQNKAALGRFIDVLDKGGMER
jgi:hypothetical protein